MRVFDFDCAGCATTFEALVGSEAETPPCPTCGSRAVARRPVVRVAVHTRKGRRGRVIDLSSHACPCARRAERA